MSRLDGLRFERSRSERLLTVVGCRLLIVAAEERSVYVRAIEVRAIEVGAFDDGAVEVRVIKVGAVEQLGRIG